MFEKALDIATRYHEGQVDKAGKPYILHPLTLAKAAKTLDEAVVALLHDVVEDTVYTEEQLRYDFPDYIADAVMAMTRHAYGEETYAEFILRVKKNPLARRVKLLDLKHNLTYRGVAIPENLTKRYVKAVKELRDEP